MTHKQIINLNNSGNLKTSTLALTPSAAQFLKTGLSKFLEQCCIIEKAYLQMKDDDLSCILHGKNGNTILWVNRRNLKEDTISASSLPKDFLLEGTANKSKIRQIISELPTQSSASFIRKLSLVERGGTRNRTSYCIQNTQTQNLSFEVGVNAFSIPMIVSNIKNNSNLITVINLNQTNDPNYVSMNEDTLKKEEIPLITLGSARQVGYRSRNAYDSFNLICRNNKSIVKKPSNKYKLAKIKILYELPIGHIHGLLKGINKKDPFGKIDLHYDTTGEEPKFSIKINNENETVSRNPLDIQPIYFEKNEKGKAQINYRQWFDNVQSSRANSNSYKNLINLKEIKNSDLKGTELIGINHKNLIVYGIKYTHKKQTQILLTTLGCNEIVESDEKVYEAAVVKKVKKSKKKVTPVKQTPIKEPDFDSPIYKKWRKITDKEYVDRNEQIKTDVTNVFTKYISSGQEITEEDTNEFTKLLGLESKTN